MNSIKELRQRCQYTKVGGDYIFHRLIYRKISIYLTKVLIKTPITANQVTIISIFVGLTGGLFLALGKSSFYLIGALLYNFSVVLDVVDGEIARYRGTSGMRGQYLDLLAHYFISASIFACLSFSLYKDLGNIYIIIFGFTAAISTVIAKTSVALVYHSAGMKRRGFFDISGNRQNFSKNRKTNSGIKQSIHKKTFSIERFYRKFIEELFCDLLIIMNLLIFAVLNIFLPPLRIFSYQLKFITIFFLFYGIFLPFDMIKKIIYTIYSDRFSIIYDELFKKDR